MFSIKGDQPAAVGAPVALSKPIPAKRRGALMVQGEQVLEEFSIDQRHRPAVTVVGIFVRRISRLSWSVNPPTRSTSLYPKDDCRICRRRSKIESASVRLFLLAHNLPDSSLRRNHASASSANGCSWGPNNTSHVPVDSAR